MRYSGPLRHCPGVRVMRASGRAGLRGRCAGSNLLRIGDRNHVCSGTCTCTFDMRMDER